MEFILLDGRHKGLPLFKFAVILRGSQNRIELFHKMRIWCWDTYGASTERDACMRMWKLHTWNWAWHVDDECSRIYFKDEAELTMFKLKWC